MYDSSVRLENLLRLKARLLHYKVVNKTLSVKLNEFGYGL